MNSGAVIALVRLPMLVVAGICATLAVAPEAAARTRAAEITSPTTWSRVHRRPLMRSGRIQYCLKQIGRYEGRINGRMTPMTVRALRRLRDDFELKGDDVAEEWTLHVVLWRQCRDAWVRDGGRLDRFGIPEVAATASATKPQAQAARNQVPSSAAAGEPPPVVVRPSSPSGFCLPAELRELLLRSQGGQSDIGVCDRACLPMPSDLDRGDAQAYERRFGFGWCRSCVAYDGDLSLDDIARIEKAGNLTLCPDPRRLLRPRPAVEPPAAALMIDSLRGTRALFRRDIRAGDAHAGVAVVISVSAVGGGPQRLRAERDAAGIQALLVERLGFRANRVIQLKDPSRSTMEDVFGGSNSIRGLLSDRLKDAAESPILVYFAGPGAIDDDNGEAYLVLAGGTPGRARTTGYQLATLYQNLTRIGTGPVTVVLEADFASNPDLPIVSPNGPAAGVGVLPRVPQKNLTVITATDRDQRPLADRDTGLSLFTRYLIEGLSGFADMAPIGNGDGGVDSIEAFVYAANRTGIAARKLSGVLQRPQISQSKAVSIGRLGAPVR